jgi:hypothetical protein
MTVHGWSTLALGVAFGLALPPAGWARTDSTNAQTTDAPAAYGASFSESIFDADNLARAKTTASGVAAEARVSALSGRASQAQAEWFDTWTSATTSGSLFVSGLAVTGTLSPALDAAVNGAGSRFGILYYLDFKYQLGDQAWVEINIDYDGSLSSPIVARWKPSAGAAVVNLVPQIAWGTNAAGDTTFALNVSGAPVGLSAPCSGPCAILESMSVVMQLEDFGPGYGGPTYSGVLASDFLHTFTVNVGSEDPTAAWASEGGRTITPVPEPQSAWLLAAGMAVLGTWARAARRRQA